MARCVKGKYRVSTKGGAHRCYTKAKGKACACPKGKRSRKRGKR
jgi:hypothetical protein